PRSPRAGSDMDKTRSPCFGGARSFMEVRATGSPELDAALTGYQDAPRWPRPGDRRSSATA
ncbi:hypothetical protein VM98_37125, partial [Streptomyces rubellomurinus subsp. indigoferus]